MTKILLYALLSSAPLFADGSVRQSLTQLGTTNTWVLAYAWTGDASTGTVPITAASMAGCSCQGYLFSQVEIVPLAPAPTAGYSVAILDAGGADVLDGAAASLSASSTQAFAAASSATPLQGTFRLSISGQSVASAKGTVYVFLSKPGTVNLATLGRGLIDLNAIQGLNVMSCGAKGDGVTDDTSAIQTCLNKAAAGSVVYVPKQSFLVTTLTVAKSLTFWVDGAISGSGAPVLSLTASSVTVMGVGRITATALAANVVKVGAGLSDIHIRGLTITAAGKTSDEANRTQGNGIWVQGDASNPLLLCGTRTSRVEVSSVTVSGGNNDVLVQCGQDVRITGSAFVNSHAGLAQVSLQSTNNSVISGDTFRDTGHTANAVYVLHLADAPSTGNTITGNSAYGTYDFEVVNVFGAQNVVSGNSLQSTSVAAGKAQAGVRLTQPAGGDTASRTHDNVVANNTIVLADVAAAVGIQVNDNGSAANYGSLRNALRGNVIHAPAAIVLSDYGASPNVEGNQTSGVGYSSCATCDGISIQGTGVTSAVIANNRATGFSRHGIYLNTCPDAQLANNEADANGQNGINLDGATRVVLVANKTRSNTATGLVLGNSANVTVMGHESSGNSSADLSFGTATFQANPMLGQISVDSTGKQLVLVNNFGILGTLAGGGAGGAILFRDPGNQVVLRNSETTGVIDMQTNGASRVSIDQSGNTTVKTGFFKINSAGSGILKHFTVTASLNFVAPGVPGCTADQTITATTAALGDTVTLGVPVTMPAGFVAQAWVSATDTVSIRWCQFSGGATDPDGAGGTYRVDIWQH